MIASQVAYKEIKKMIVAGEFFPGQKVAQVKLAKKLGCSTVPIVEALRRLESEGLLVKEGRRMAKVRQLSLDETEGIILIREGLEPIAARLCAERITEEQLKDLQQLLEETQIVEKTETKEIVLNLDERIHNCIGEGANCPFFFDVLKQLRVMEMINRRGENIFDITKIRSVHSKIIQAIIDKEGDLAEFLMKKHIQSVHKESLQSKQKKKKYNRKSNVNVESKSTKA